MICFRFIVFYESLKLNPFLKVLKLSHISLIQMADLAGEENMDVEFCLCVNSRFEIEVDHESELKAWPGQSQLAIPPP